MNEHSKTITREELYEEVWRMPVSALASIWEVSASSITKACSEMNVPQPASDYWQLVGGGQSKVERQPLPPASEDILPQTVLLTAQPKVSNSGKAPIEPQVQHRGGWPKNRIAKEPFGARVVAESNPDACAAPKLPERSNDVAIFKNAEMACRTATGEGRPNSDSRFEQALNVTRESLYEAVWRKPISKLAVHWGISASKIATTCKNLGVPYPSRNYWQLLANGARVGREPLTPSAPSMTQNASKGDASNADNSMLTQSQLHTESSPSWKSSAVERSRAIDAFYKIETAVRLIGDAIADYPRLEALQLDPLLRELSQGMQILALDDSELDLQGLMLKHEWKVGQRFYARAKVQDGSHSKFLVLAAQEIPENIVITGHVRRLELGQWQVVGLHLEIRRKDSKPAWHIRAIDL